MSAQHPAGTIARPRLLLPAISVAIPAVIFGAIVVSIVLAIATDLGLSSSQTTTLIVAGYAGSSLVSLGLTFHYRQPLFLIWSSTSLIFIASQAGTFSYPEMLGATFVAGFLILLVGMLGLSTWLAAHVPAPIVYGILAGLIMPYVVRLFSDMDKAPLLLGVTLSTYIVSRWRLSASVPPILPAIAAGVLVAGLTGDLGHLPLAWDAPIPGPIWPAFSVRAILTLTPVLVILSAALANLQGVVILRSLDYDPPERRIDMVCGVSTMAMAFFAPVPVTMGNFFTALTAGPDAGEKHQRHWSVYATSAGMLAIGLFASVATGLAGAVPVALLFGVAGLALFGVLSQAIGEVARGPLRIGPLFAFVAASSNLSLAGFGSAFWALVIGMAATLALERSEWRMARAVA